MAALSAGIVPPPPSAASQQCCVRQRLNGQRLNGSAGGVGHQGDPAGKDDGQATNSYWRCCWRLHQQAAGGSISRQQATASLMCIMLR